MRDEDSNAKRHLRREFQRAGAIVQYYGLKTAAQKASGYPGRLVASKVAYFRHRKRYPTNVVFMASFAKSGSTWLTNMLADLPGFSRYQPAGWTATLQGQPNEDLYPGIFEEVGRRLVVIKGHTFGTPENTERLHAVKQKYLLTVRDPRDQLISDYWYLRNHPRHPSHELAMSFDLSAFIGHELDPRTARTRRTDWIRGWVERRDHDLSMLIRYEDLLKEPAVWLKQILDFLGFEVSDSRISDIVTRNSFEVKSGRTAGIEDTSSFLRRGTAGEWTQVFSEEHRRLFASRDEDLVHALGYEPTCDDRE